MTRIMRFVDYKLETLECTIFPVACHFHDNYCCVEGLQASARTGLQQATFGLMLHNAMPAEEVFHEYLGASAHFVWQIRSTPCRAKVLWRIWCNAHKAEKIEVPCLWRRSMKRLLIGVRSEM